MLSLSLCKSPELNDKALIVLTKASADLCELDISGCANFTDTCIIALVKCVTLTNLRFVVDQCVLCGYCHFAAFC
jgi:hypothetical protein